MKQIITDLWNWNSIKKYDVLDLQKFINSDKPILSVQKSIIKNWLDKILLWAWIDNIDQKILEENIWRAGFFSIDSKEFWELWFLWSKWSDSTKSFSEISNYYLWWTDIWDKVQSRWLELEEKARILGENLWWYKTELLLLLWRETAEIMKLLWEENYNLDLDILTTKFTPTLTKKVIEQLPKNMISPVINTVDSNSELNIQIQEILNPWWVVWAIEIVQSWKSLIATDSFVVKDWNVFEPSIRNKDNWEFEWKIIWKIDPNSQAWRIANWIQSEVDLALYKIISDKNDKKDDFIKAIQNSMKQFNK